MEELSLTSGGWRIHVKIQLLELSQDQKLEEVLDYSDSLTIFKEGSVVEEDDTEDDSNDFFVIIMSKDKEDPIFLLPSAVSKLDLKKLASQQRIAVFR